MSKEIFENEDHGNDFGLHNNVSAFLVLILILSFFFFFLRAVFSFKLIFPG